MLECSFRQEGQTEEGKERKGGARKKEFKPILSNSFSMGPRYFWMYSIMLSIWVEVRRERSRGDLVVGCEEIKEVKK